MKARKSKKWSREKLASEIPTSFQTIYRWEKGISRPSPIMERRLDEIFR
ncbi:MAG: helix-turn-helix transcriptional regulator [Candidatus Omnitrophota bacterium]|nr:MAG: helix-turn-helix transcriptional regulator [Candidatus Omnitrophota bacterium]